jgi:hypothetical protein
MNEEEKLRLRKSYPDYVPAGWKPAPVTQCRAWLDLRRPSFSDTELMVMFR